MQGYEPLLRFDTSEGPPAYVNPNAVDLVEKSGSHVRLGLRDRGDVFVLGDLDMVAGRIDTAKSRLPNIAEPERMRGVSTEGGQAFVTPSNVLAVCPRRDGGCFVWIGGSVRKVIMPSDLRVEQAMDALGLWERVDGYDQKGTTTR